MEKKTIGKFISALRRANGMTQKELGEKLYVSDKTVSRWERDECTPELSLIPVIAEIFGVTTDELLRGERNNPTAQQNAEETAERNKNKSDKQFRLLLDNRMRKYKNLTFISVGATLLAVVLAFIINLVAYQALLAFFLATACLLGSEICQIMFALNLRLTETEENRAREIKTLNSQINTVVVRLSFINLLLFAFVLPLAAIVPASHLGLSIDTWTFYGVIFAAITLLVAYMVYAFLIRERLTEREILCFDEQKTAVISRNVRFLKKLVIVGAAIALVAGAGAITVNALGVDAFTEKEIFRDVESFKTYMQTECDELGGNDKVYDVIKDRDGNVICEYYYASFLYQKVDIVVRPDASVYIEVIVKTAYWNAWDTHDTLLWACYGAVVADIAVCTLVYAIYATRPIKKK